MATIDNAKTWLEKEPMYPEDEGMFKYLTKKIELQKEGTLFTDAMKKNKASIGRPARLSRILCPCGMEKRLDG